MLEALAAFMAQDEEGLGSLRYSKRERKALAIESRLFECVSCGKLTDHEVLIIENTKKSRKISSDLTEAFRSSNEQEMLAQASLLSSHSPAVQSLAPAESLEPENGSKQSLLEACEFDSFTSLLRQSIEFEEAARSVEYAPIEQPPLSPDIPHYTVLPPNRSHHTYPQLKDTKRRAVVIALDVVMGVMLLIVVVGFAGFLGDGMY